MYKHFTVITQKPFKMFRPFKRVSFASSRNSVKMKVFIFLHNNDKVQGWSVGDMAYNLGLSNSSLSILVRRWVNWGYLDRQGIPRLYTYRLARHGRDWMLRNRQYAPVQRYITEVMAYRQRAGI